MILGQLEFLGVLDGDDALAVGDERGKHVQGCGLTGAGTAGDDHVQLADDAGLQEAGRVGAEGAEADQVIDPERVGGELTNGEKRSTDGQGRDHGVDTGTIGQAGIAQRRRLVDTTTDLGNDLVDDASEVELIGEGHILKTEFARPLGEDLIRTIAHDLGDVLVPQKLVDRAVAENVVGNVLDELGSVGGRERGALLGQRRRQRVVDLLAKLFF